MSEETQTQSTTLPLGRVPKREQAARGRLRLRPGWGRTVARICARAYLWTFGCVVVVVGCLHVYLCMPFVPKGREVIIATAEVPGVVRCMATQTPNSLGEPFYVRFWHQYPGEAWRRSYVDHESTFWWHGELRIDAQHHTVSLWRGDEWIGLFDWQADGFWLGDDVPDGYRNQLPHPEA